MVFFFACALFYTFKKPLDYLVNCRRFPFPFSEQMFLLNVSWVVESLLAFPYRCCGAENVSKFCVIRRSFQNRRLGKFSMSVAHRNRWVEYLPSSLPIGRAQIEAIRARLHFPIQIIFFHIWSHFHNGGQISRHFEFILGATVLFSWCVSPGVAA